MSSHFTWEASGLPGVPREVIEHKLAVNNDAKPVKQVLRKQSKEKLDFIISEVDKLIEAGVNLGGPSSNLGGQSRGGSKASDLQVASLHRLHRPKQGLPQGPIPADRKSVV